MSALKQVQDNVAAMFEASAQEKGITTKGHIAGMQSSHDFRSLTIRPESEEIEAVELPFKMQSNSFQSALFGGIAMTSIRMLFDVCSKMEALREVESRLGRIKFERDGTPSADLMLRKIAALASLYSWAYELIPPMSYTGRSSNWYREYATPVGISELVAEPFERARPAELLNAMAEVTGLTVDDLRKRDHKRAVERAAAKSNSYSAAIVRVSDEVCMATPVQSFNEMQECLMLLGSDFQGRVEDIIKKLTIKLADIFDDAEALLTAQDIKAAKRWLDQQ